MSPHETEYSQEQTMSTVIKRVPEFIRCSPSESGSNGACIHVPASAVNLSGFRAWAVSDDLPEKTRVTYVDNGIYIDLSKETQHNALAKSEISGVVWNLSREQELGDFFSNGVLVTNEIAGVSTNPDAVLLTYDSLEAGRVRWVTGAKPHINVEIEGTPDWILEIVSDSSVFKDTKQLRVAYRRAGIPEYWLVDVRGDVIEFQILQWRKKGYVAAPVKDGWQKSRVLGRAFQLTRNRSRKGFWRYTLLVHSA
jgi:Uma2 family endonuclease